jgi:elongation factor G
MNSSAGPREHLDMIRKLRNIGVLAHVDAGKTSITEKMLQLAGLKGESGSVDEGTTATDYLAVERLHGITVKSAAVRFEWKDASIHLIDTPGHVDFGNEVERALRILDGAVIALCAVSGIQARSEYIARTCSARRLPRIYFINKMDRAGSDFHGILAELAAGLEPGAVALQYPLFEGQRFSGFVDLPSLRVTKLADDDAVDAAFESLPAIDRNAALQARARLIEKLSEHDDMIMEHFASDIDVPGGILHTSLAGAVHACLIAPVLCGSAFEASTISALLDAAAGFLPSPMEARVPDGFHPGSGDKVELRADPALPLAAFIFKTMRDSEGELYAWARIWTGSLVSGGKVLDARTTKEVQVRKLFGIQADTLIPMDSAGPGEIVALKGGNLEAGTSLCHRSAPVAFEALERPEPVVRQVFEPSSPQEASAVRQALSILSLEDLSLVVREETETGRFEVAGQGELHLEILAERLKREFGLRIRTGNPQVNCREVLRGNATVLEEFDRDFGGERVRVTVELRAELNPDPGSVEILFSEGLRPQPQFQAAALRGAGAAASVGPSEGWPMDRLRVVIMKLLPPPPGAGRNGETAVEAATALALRRALLQAGSKVFEPMMQLDIECPEEYFGAVLGAVSARGGRIESVEEGLQLKTITACAAMSRLFGFAGEMRSTSKGRAQFQARFRSYETRAQSF